MLDLNNAAEEARAEDEGTAVHIHGLNETPLYYEVDGEQKPVIIRVAGSNSSRVRKFNESLRRRKLKASALTQQRIFDDGVDRVVAATIDWEGIGADGEVMEPTRENIRAVYVKLPWVLDQVAEAMDDHSRFFQNGSSKQ